MGRGTLGASRGIAAATSSTSSQAHTSQFQSYSARLAEDINSLPRGSRIEIKTTSGVVDTFEKKYYDPGPGWTPGDVWFNITKNGYVNDFVSNVDTIKMSLYDRQVRIVKRR